MCPTTPPLSVLVQGLIDLGLLHGTVDGNIESEAYRQFYMHRIGHWLGLTMHDVAALSWTANGALCKPAW